MMRAPLVCLAAMLPAMAAAQRLPEVPTEQLIEDCIPAAERELPYDSLGAARRLELMTCLQRVASEAMNPQLPLRIDEVTVLERTSSEGPVLIYHNRIEREIGALPGDAGPRLEQSTRGYVCAQPPMVRTISRGGSYGYVWTDRSGRLVHRMMIASC